MSDGSRQLRHYLALREHLPCRVAAAVAEIGEGEAALHDDDYWPARPAKPRPYRKIETQPPA